MPCCVGIDGATAQVESALRPSGERWAVPNDASGVTTLVERLQAHPLRVLEAPGGLERAVTRALATAGLPVVVVHPRQGRDCARAPGQLATTEALDARALAHGAAVIGPTPRPRPEAQTQELRALRGRRQPLIVMRTAAQHRLAGTSARLTKALAAHMPWLTTGIATLDDALETRRRARPVWRDNDDLWQRAPGSGPVCARTLVRDLPEWGTRTRQQIAALGGVAPRPCDRGTLRGRRTIWGGRAHVRSVWDMGTRVATRDTPRRHAFYPRLLAAGQVKKVALTACIPPCLTMLNARLKHRTPWQAQEVQS